MPKVIINTAREWTLTNRDKIFRRLCRDESGQAIVFGAITMLFVVIAVVMVFQAGLLVDRRMQAQDAADAAAYSGAATKAMCVNSIEWLNAGMAYVYRQMLRYSYDEMYFSGASFTGEPEDTSNFSEAHANSAEWIERGMRWMQRIGQMEEGIANASPRLVEENVHSVAYANGARAVALWPNWPEYEAFISRDDHLNCVFEPQGNRSWLVASNSDYVLRVERPWTGNFAFNIHDNYFAHNGVRAQDAVGFRVSGTSPTVTGNTIRFYDGTTYIMSLAMRPLDPGPPPVNVIVVNYGDGTEEYVDLQTLQDSGTLTLPLDSAKYPNGYPYRYASLTWLLQWTGRGGPRATLDAVTVNYGNTYVQSLPSDTYISGGFSNGSLSAGYVIMNGSVSVSGGGSLTAVGSRTLYEDNRGIGASAAPPAFVEDNVSRFLSRSPGVPSPPNIDPALARTRQSDDFGVFVQSGPGGQRIIQSQSWRMYGGADDYQSVDLARVPLPLSVTEEYFRYGVNVGVWMPQESTIPFFHNPRHGFFAVASAALGKRAAAAGDMLTPPDDSLLVVELPYWSEDFYAQAGYSYVKTFDSVEERYSRVKTAGSQGYWQPVLVPLKGAILPEDLNFSGFAYSSSAELIYESLVNSRWFDPATGLENSQVPLLLADIRKPEYEAMMNLQPDMEQYEVQEWFGPPFEYSGQEFDDSVQH